MELETTCLPATTKLYGEQIIELAAGKHFKIETSPAGQEILDAVCPRGKAWRVTVSVQVDEAPA